MIQQGSGLSVSRQCDLLNVPRSSFYYKPIPANEETLSLMKAIDCIYLDNPSYGSRRIKEELRRSGYNIGRDRTSSLMREMGLEAIYTKPKIKTSEAGIVRFPYLLKDLSIKACNQVWGTDITYIPVKNGYIYLVAFLDLYSRFVLGWSLSDSLETTSCLEALKMAFQCGLPGIINSDRGVQYTSKDYLNLVQSRGARISMSGKGKCWDNIFVERFWRSLKYEEVYLNCYDKVEDAHEGIGQYISHYNTKRLHSALNYHTPFEIYRGGSAPTPPGQTISGRMPFLKLD